MEDDRARRGCVEHAVDDHAVEVQVHPFAGDNHRCGELAIGTGGAQFPLGVPHFVGRDVPRGLSIDRRAMVAPWILAYRPDTYASATVGLG